MCPRKLLSALGFAPARVFILVRAGETVERDVRLARAPLMLEDIVVTADPSGRAEGELATASVIDREAIRNQIAAGLQGVLELIPGVPLSPPGLDAVQQIPLRTVPASGGGGIGGPSGQGIAAFGTLIVLDGVPLSNNANLQTAGPRGELAVPTSAGGGIDLRRIPATTLERVEVIRGVPSVRHGDLTHGAIVVETRAGAIPPELQARYEAPRDWLLSLQVAKALPGEGRLSFYAFNALDREGRLGPNGVIQRPFPGMRFGAEVSLPLQSLLDEWLGG